MIQLIYLFICPGAHAKLKEINDLVFFKWINKALKSI